MEQDEQQEKQRKLKTGAAASTTSDSVEGSGMETIVDAEKEGEGLANSHGLVDNQARGEEYISAGGISMLDISTRLRITEAELAIVRREVSELLAERNALETQCQRHEESWKFALQQLGRAIEQRNEAFAQIHVLETSMNLSRPTNKSPEYKTKKVKLKVELETLQQQLETQTRVSRQLEYERDRANDDYEFANAQLSTVMQQHQDLQVACAEVAREKEKAIAEAQMLRKELNRYDSELHSAADLEGEGGGDRERALLQQLKLLREEKAHLKRACQQTLEQYKRQLNKANVDRRHAMASADAMRALLQKRLDAAQVENADLRQDNRAAYELINHLQEQLAETRLAQQHQQKQQQHQQKQQQTGQVAGGADDKEAVAFTHQATPSSNQTSSASNRSSTHKLAPTLSQDTGIALYTSDGGYGTTGSPLTQNELISPGAGSSLTGYRVASSTHVRRPYIPTSSPFPEESQERGSSDDGASWI